jgi:hypothetical protein
VGAVWDDDDVGFQSIVHSISLVTTVCLGNAQ